MTGVPLDPPTISEIMRRLDSIAQQLGDITKEIKQDRAEAARLYVTRELYVAQRQADASVVADLAGDIKAVETNLGRDIKAVKDDLGRDIEALQRQRQTDQQQRRQMLMWLGGLTVTVLLGLGALIISILTLVL